MPTWTDVLKNLFDLLQMAYLTDLTLTVGIRRLSFQCWGRGGGGWGGGRLSMTLRNCALENYSPIVDYSALLSVKCCFCKKRANVL